MYSEFEKFRPFPMTESHAHIEVREPITDTAAFYEKHMAYFGYEKLLLLSVIDLIDHPVDPLCNLKCLYVKKELQGKCYAFTSLRHYYDSRDNAEDYLRQVKDAWEMGFDGLKLLENKPGLRKKLGRGIDAPIYEPMFSYVEEHNIPVTAHVTDPAYFWSRDTADYESRLKRGWVYDASYKTRHEIFTEVENVLKRHPKLRLTIAHLMVDHEDVAWAEHFVTDYPNTGFDLTACATEYSIMQTAPEAWHQFLLNHSDRLYFGTDSSNGKFEPDGRYKNWGHTSYTLSRTFLEGKEPFTFSDGVTYVPYDLPDEVIRNIYHDNFTKRLGESPRKIQSELVVKDCDLVSETVRSHAFGEEIAAFAKEDLLNLEVIRTYFGSSVS